MTRRSSIPDLDRLLGLIRASDQTAFAEWAGLATPLLTRRLRRYAPAADPNDVVQETLLRIWQHAPEFVADGRPKALLRFAVSCARNLARDALRRRRRKPRSLSDLTTTTTLDRRLTADPVEPDPAFRRLLEAGFARLPSGPRAALGARLGRRAALPDNLLAAQVGMRPNTFLQNIVRARRALAAHLAAAGVEAPITAHAA